MLTFRIALIPTVSLGAALIFALGRSSPLQATIVGLYSVPSEMLRILAEMSWDTLFLLVGLGFLAVAVLGNISGKISPGKGGRIAAGLVGAGFAACGFWYHTAIHSFKVTVFDVAPPQSQNGPCPLSANLEGIVGASGSGDVIYYFEFSNGNVSRTDKAHFQQTGSQTVQGVWEVHESLKDAWVRLHVFAPEDKPSRQSKPFAVTCVPDSAGGAQPSAPAAVAATGATTQPSAGGSFTAAPATAIAPPVHIVDDSSNSVALDSVDPKPGTYLKRGQPVTFNINVSYNLVSADSAILSIRTGQLRTSPAGCRDGVAELTDDVEVPISRGKNQTQVSLKWSGDTGSATGGRTYGRGYVSFLPMFWASNNGARGARLNYFGTYVEYCYPFGQ